VKVQSQHCRLDWIYSWFLFKLSDIQLKLVEPCAFGKQGFGAALSQNADLLGLGWNVICVCRSSRLRLLESSCQKVCHAQRRKPR